jgi:hypothetical protein
MKDDVVEMVESRCPIGHTALACRAQAHIIAQKHRQERPTDEQHKPPSPSPNEEAPYTLYLRPTLDTRHSNSANTPRHST